MEKTSMRKEVEETRDLLLLVGYRIPMKRIWGWSAKEIESVQNYCIKIHLRASDHAVRIPEKPYVLNCISRKQNGGGE